MRPASYASWPQRWHAAGRACCTEGGHEGLPCAPKRTTPWVLRVSPNTFRRGAQVRDVWLHVTDRLCLPGPGHCWRRLTPPSLGRCSYCCRRAPIQCALPDALRHHPGRSVTAASAQGPSRASHQGAGRRGTGAALARLRFHVLDHGASPPSLEKQRGRAPADARRKTR